MYVGFACNIDYYSAIKMLKSSSSVTTWADLDDIRISEVSKIKKKKTNIYDFTHIWNMKTKHKQDKRTNQNKTSNTDKENRVVITRGGER